MNSPLVLKLPGTYSNDILAASTIPIPDGLSELKCDLKEVVCKYLALYLPEVRRQFTEIMSEILPWIKKNFPLRPEADRFADWYIINKYEPYIRAQALEAVWCFTTYEGSSEIVTSCEINIPSNALPAVIEEDIVEYCSHLYNKIEKAKSKPIITVYRDKKAPESEGSLGWMTDEICSRKLYDVLLYHKYIDCSFEVFKGILGLSPFTRRVTWLKSLRVLLFLILYLQDKKLISKKKQHDWVLFQSLFVGLNGESYKPGSIRSTLQTMKKEGLNGPMILLKDRLSKIKW